MFLVKAGINSVQSGFSLRLKRSPLLDYGIDNEQSAKCGWHCLKLGLFGESDPGEIHMLGVQSGRGNVSSATLEERFEAEAMPHLNDLFRTATRVMGDRGRAEDVVQDVYLQAWKSFNKFEPGTNCRAWLFKILFHCINHSRRKWFRFPLLKPTEEFVEANLAFTPSIPEHLTDEEILAALDRIPADFRAVVMLVDVEEFAYREAAEILSTPIGTVMSRLSRGRKLLRDQLQDVAQSYGVARRLEQEVP